MKRCRLYLFNLIFLITLSVLFSDKLEAQNHANGQALTSPLLTPTSPATVESSSVQDTGPGGGPGAEDTDAPIDGGIILLLAAGIGYGVKKYRENRNIHTVQFE